MQICCKKHNIFCGIVNGIFIKRWKFLKYFACSYFIISNYDMLFKIFWKSIRKMKTLIKVWLLKHIEKPAGTLIIFVIKHEARSFWNWMDIAKYSLKRIKRDPDIQKGLSVYRLWQKENTGSKELYCHLQIVDGKISLSSEASSILESHIPVLSVYFPCCKRNS